MNYETRINNYLSGGMSSAEKDKFVQELNSNEDLQEVFFEVLTPAYAEQYLRNSIRAKIKPASTKISRYYPVVAASIVLILALSFFIGSHSFSPKYDINYFVEYPVPGKIRGEETNKRPEAFRYFEERNYEKAYAAFMKLEETAQTNLYRGICLLHFTEKNKQKSAIPYFLKVLHSGTNLDETAQWFLAIAYFQTGAKAKAKDLLLKISNDNTHYNHNKATEFLKIYY